jgi:hypothetical protein
MRLVNHGMGVVCFLSFSFPAISKLLV